MSDMYQQSKGNIYNQRLSSRDIDETLLLVVNKFGKELQGTPVPGVKGEKGDKGDVGPQGIQGPKGEQGPAGKDAVINVVTQAEYDALPDKTGIYFIGG